jgi:hypothetical protein
MLVALLEVKARPCSLNRPRAEIGNSMSSSHVDRSLLFGIVALQIGVAAFAWDDDAQSYEAAVASLTDGTSKAKVDAAVKLLEQAGEKAFPVLIAHRNDKQKAAFGQFVEERVDRFGRLEEPTVGDVCFCTIRYEVEGKWPKD